MKLLRLKKHDELVEFQKKTHALIGVLYPMEYLEKARVYGFKQEQILMAGFFFISQGPLRTVRSLPAEFEVPERLTEISGIWINPEVKDRASVLKFWLGMCACAAPELNRTLIFTYSSSKRGLKKLYDMFSPREIYHGPVAALEGMAGDDIESINLLAAPRLVFLPVINPAFFYHRIFASNRFRGAYARSKFQIFNPAR